MEYVAVEQIALGQKSLEGGIMIIKVIKYDPVKGKGIYQKPNGEKVNFRYTKFANKPVLTGQLGFVNEAGEIIPAKKYHWPIWIVRRILCR